MIPNKINAQIDDMGGLNCAYPVKIKMMDVHERDDPPGGHTTKSQINQTNNQATTTNAPFDVTISFNWTIFE